MSLIRHKVVCSMLCSFESQCLATQVLLLYLNNCNAFLINPVSAAAFCLRCACTGASTPFLSIVCVTQVTNSPS
jgi:hypothetical protein